MKLARAAWVAAVREVVDDAVDDATLITRVSSKIYAKKWSLVKAFRSFDRSDVPERPTP